MDLEKIKPRTFHDVKIAANSLTSRLIIGGFDLSAQCVEVTFHHTAGERPYITIELDLKDYELDLKEIEVRLQEGKAEAQV